ncbi:MAG TPA: BamA/TamA family outer membrane protein [Vicinamibacterales bacterium]|nr:BamA/TamA family outer membrane protein [Vicinamibacterales bacterium]
MSRRAPAFAVAAIALVVAAAGSTGAYAQETRAEALEQARSEKARALAPYEPRTLEKWMLWFERTDPIRKISPHDGFYLQYGFRWKPVGGGVGVGGGWRHDLFNRHARIVLGGGISTRNYQMLQADFSLPYLVGDRVEVGGLAVYRHNPQEDYWGLGNDSVKDNRVSFKVDYRNYEGRAIVRPLPWLEAGTRFGRLDGTIGEGTDSRFPSIEELFTDETAPGLAAQPDFSYAEAFAAVDYRDQEDNARDGGFYSLSWRNYSDRDFDRYSFRAVDAIVQQFFPIFDKKRVFAVQGRLQSAAVEEGAGQQVPFYFKPTLGGSTSLRSFNDYRFRDDAVVYVNVEYRWEAFSGMDMALFSDWGTVAPNIGRLKISHVKHGYGIGFRFNTYKSVLFRVDIGFGGGEGVQTFVKFSKAF